LGEKQLIPKQKNRKTEKGKIMPGGTVGYPGIFWGGGGLTNLVVDRGQTERGSRGGSPYSGFLEAAVIWYKKFHFM